MSSSSALLIATVSVQDKVPKFVEKYNCTVQMIERLINEPQLEQQLGLYHKIFVICPVTLDQLYTIFTHAEKGGALWYSEEDALLLTGCIDVVKATTNDILSGLYCGSVPDYDLEMEEQLLLTEEDKKKPIYENGQAKRQPCANCTCGLKEELDNKIKVDTKEISKNGCGNCSLGDAFRCASCPYLGMPAFKSGEEVALKGMFAEDDI